MRNLRIDVARGLLMLYIVTVAHGFYWLDIYAGPAKSLILFEMPCIFFLSGYAYALSARAGARVDSVPSYLVYLCRRALRILAPYWLYAAACLCFLFLKGGPGLTDSTGAKIATAVAWLNPLEFGQGHTFFVLNAHLWFVAPFLGVTLIMPVAAWFLRGKPPPLAGLMLLGGVLILSADFLVQPELGKTILSYAVWSVLGYAACAGGAGLTRGQALLVFGTACALLAVARTLGWVQLDMQANKFPPNAAFYLFGVAWFSLWSLAAGSIKDSTLERLRAAAWLRPFIEKGYSIYLWQGLAYVLARAVGNRVDAPLVAVWLLAVLFALLLGMAAAPAEALRLPSSARR